MILQSLKKINIAKTSVFIGFAIIYSIISFINHYLFRSNAHDFGIYNQALYDYAHLRLNNNTVLEPGFGNLLSDHFEILMMIFSPLYYIFGTYTLLIIQIAAIVIGAQGIYKYVELISIVGNLALVSVSPIHFFFSLEFIRLFPAIITTTIVGQWLFHGSPISFIKEKWKQTIIVLIIFFCQKRTWLCGLLYLYRFCMTNSKDR